MDNWWVKRKKKEKKSRNDFEKWQFHEKCKLPFAQGYRVTSRFCHEAPYDTSPRSKPIFDLRKPDVRKYWSSQGQICRENWLSNFQKQQPPDSFLPLRLTTRVALLFHHRERIVFENFSGIDDFRIRMRWKRTWSVVYEKFLWTHDTRSYRTDFRIFIRLFFFFLSRRV